MAIKKPDEVSPAVRDQIAQLLAQLKGEQVAHWVMDQVFSPEERTIADQYMCELEKQRRRDQPRAKRTGQKKGKSRQERPNTPHAVNLFAHVRQLDRVVATIDLGYLKKLLTPQDYKWLRREIGIDEVDYGVELRRAIAEADLVVDEYRRLVIWKQREFAFESDDKIWTYFWKLCCAASNGGSITPQDFSSQTESRNLADWKARLGALRGFAGDLRDQIAAKGGRHRLEVPAKQIRVFPMKRPGAAV